MSDGGQCFVSTGFKEFLSHNGIKHLKFAPYHPASNGLAERAMKKRNKKDEGWKCHRQGCKSSI